ncbi:MAG: hypothetical protein WC346_02220 [Methanogenium sp.]|jgi:hypothetical protein
MQATIGSDMPDYAQWFVEDLEQRIKIYPKTAVKQRIITTIPIPNEW